MSYHDVSLHSRTIVDPFLDLAELLLSEEMQPSKAMGGGTRAWIEKDLYVEDNGT